MEPIRVLIADDHPLMLEGLDHLIGSQEDMEVVAKATSGQEAVELAREMDPDVVLMDIRMPGLDGVEATRRIRYENPRIRVLILTVCEDDASVFSAVKAGACGYMLKDVKTDVLLEAIRRAADGESIIHPAIASRVLGEFQRLSQEREQVPANTLHQLTRREMEILRCLTEGMSNKEIAFRLGISEKTVKNHLSSIFEKLQVNDRLQALIYAFKHHLVHNRT